LTIIKNVSGAANQHIRMISGGSCDTSNDPEDSALITGINYIFKYYYTKIENSIFKLL